LALPGGQCACQRNKWRSVQRAERFVHQQDARLQDQNLRQGTTPGRTNDRNELPISNRNGHVAHGCVARIMARARLEGAGNVAQRNSRLIHGYFFKA
jgi:hypothetical protein